MTTAALLVIDLQVAFDDRMGRHNNPDAAANAAALARAWSRAGLPLVYVRHDSRTRASPLQPGTSGHPLRPELTEITPDLLVPKHRHSAFHGETDLDGWLTGRGIRDLVVAGMETNRCVETTTRVGHDLGYRIRFALDATHAYDAVSPSGRMVSAEELAEVTATNLHGEFAEVTDTAAVLASVS